VPEDDAREILARAEYGVLATVGEEGWPYAVPLNHVIEGGVLYVHSALEGHKLDNIAHDERVCYCAVASAQVLPEKLSTLYESAIIFGRAAQVTDPIEKKRALRLLAARFYASPEQTEEELRKAGAHAAVVRIRIERITGKAHRASK
jgi:hypothetical protein